jgi:hypothetical protein
MKHYIVTFETSDSIEAKMGADFDDETTVLEAINELAELLEIELETVTMVKVEQVTAEQMDAQYPSEEPEDN